ncbi:crotonobetaine/carnitine-CoA ligase [Tamaricihabitans halophyticus]|uniref:Crotonobetaine/carnitine-CoA ligase n=1 Tax=Tamaricihabitans halophyticus TaxID=1262583 RepID=A0A4R2QE37_9PSEU|nr:AMP-binding protein [Tamaricihabitans halophyticus]TCP47342.1 crotonobetaine/carnitine-CoA ligase [Tamaricihabitans halophyticus]
MSRSPLDSTWPADLRTLTARAAERWPDRTALVFDGRDDTLSFADIELRANAIAAHLADRGIGPGDRVSVMLTNRAEFVLSWLAITRLGAALVPINVYYKPFELAHLIHDSGARMLITEKALLPSVEQAADLDVVHSGLLLCDDEAGQEIFHGKVSWPLESVPAERTANIQYTSGTTGRPKGCVLSHRYWLRIARHLVAGEPRIGENDTMLTAQPFYYMDPMWNVATALLGGATLVVLERFRPSMFWEKVHQHDVSFFYCLGAMPTMLLNTPPEQRDRQHRVRAVYCSAIPTPLHAELEQRWGAPWTEMFGMTETGLDVRMPADEQSKLVGTGCIGRAVDDREARVLDPDDNPVARGDIGELVLRGVGMMDGYYRNPDATSEAFRGGWLRTGDLVRMDDSGRIFYVGRSKEMIRRSGENISATELEEVLCQHPAVQVAACVPVPDPIRQEEVKAYLVLNPEYTAETAHPSELSEFCAQRLAYFKVPRYWAYREQLPRTPSERIAKAVLRAEQDDLRSGAYDRVTEAWLT